MIKKWLDTKGFKKQLFKLSWAAFNEKYPQEILHKNWTKIVYDSDGILIIRLCYNHSKPPKRSWWKQVDESFVEIGKKEVQEYYDIPLWR